MVFTQSTALIISQTLTGKMQVIDFQGGAQARLTYIQRHSYKS
ncbi:hypothetical protein imdm_184 [gamma proteobacterium IMCC2047]|nr:hypothetical protein imdm_184 [gamma proteobacterium IMCC2047]